MALLSPTLPAVPGVHLASQLHTDPASLIPLPGAWGQLLPSGALRRGATLSVLSSFALIAELLVAATRAGLWCGVVGLPALSPAALQRAGAQLERCAFVSPGLRRPGEPQLPRGFADDPMPAVASLAEGMDIVVFAALSPGAHRRERLSARARTGGALLVAAGAWPGADLRIQVVSSQWGGLEEGYGRLTSHRVRLRADGRRLAAPRYLERELQPRV